MTPPVIWLDVTETLASGMRTGIQRVTIELARELLGQDRGRLIRLDPKTGDFVALSAEETSRLFGSAQSRPTLGWQKWAARWGLVPALGLVKDGLLAMSLLKVQTSRFDWAGGTYLTAEVLGNLFRARAVRALQKMVPTVLLFHDLFPLTAPAYSALRPRAFARHWALAVTASRLISVSRHTQEDALGYAARQGQALPPLTVCHPGHSLGDQNEAAPTPLPPPAFFLCVGTLEHRKNQAGLLKAYRGYRQAGGRVGLVIVGNPGPGSEAVVRAIGEATDHVVWYPRADDATLAWLYHRAWALVYPSRAEGFGLPLVEALAVGTPCITSNRTSTVEVAELCGGCLVVDPEDTAALGSALARFDEQGFRGELVKTIRHDHIPTWDRFFAAVEAQCRS